MKYFLVMVLSLTISAGIPSAMADLLNASGKITLLRVHDKGSKYGPPGDQIDVEVVVQLDSKPGQAFGFTLRNNEDQAAHQGMLDILRDAYQQGWRVHLDYEIPQGKKNGRVIRAWLRR